MQRKQRRQHWVNASQGPGQFYCRKDSSFCVCNISVSHSASCWQLCLAHSVRLTECIDWSVPATPSTDVAPAGDSGGHLKQALVAGLCLGHRCLVGCKARWITNDNIPVLLACKPNHKGTKVQSARHGHAVQKPTLRSGYATVCPSSVLL